MVPLWKAIKPPAFWINAKFIWFRFAPQLCKKPRAGESGYPFGHLRGEFPLVSGEPSQGIRNMSDHITPVLKSTEICP